MNNFSYPGLLFRLAYRLALRARWIAKKPVCKSFGRMTPQSPDKIQNIYVINLDRQTDRWNMMQQELQQIYDVSDSSVETTKIYDKRQNKVKAKAARALPL